MIIHISEERNARILTQGYKVEVPAQLAEDHCYQAGDTIYHLLPEDHAVCPICKEECESVPAETPVELEIIKTVLATDLNASTADLRRYVTN